MSQTRDQCLAYVLLGLTLSHPWTRAVESDMVGRVVMCSDLVLLASLMRSFCGFLDAS